MEIVCPIDLILIEFIHLAEPICSEIFFSFIKNMQRAKVDFSFITFRDNSTKKSFWDKKKFPAHFSLLHDCMTFRVTRKKNQLDTLISLLFHKSNFQFKCHKKVKNVLNEKRKEISPPKENATRHECESIRDVNLSLVTWLNVFLFRESFNFPTTIGCNNRIRNLLKEDQTNIFDGILGDFCGVVGR